MQDSKNHINSFTPFNVPTVNSMFVKAVMGYGEAHMISDNYQLWYDGNYFGTFDVYLHGFMPNVFHTKLASA